MAANVEIAEASRVQVTRNCSASHPGRRKRPNSRFQIEAYRYQAAPAAAVSASATTWKTHSAA